VKLVDAGSPLRLTSNPAAESSPTWSPDGRFIAFCRDVQQHDEIWIVPALGGAERKLGEAALCGGLSWSPDGRFLALVDRTSTQAPLAIFLLNVGSGAKRQLTTPPKESIGDVGPSFSLTGKELAFARVFTGGRSDIYTLPIANIGTSLTEPRRLASRGDTVSGTDWTADSRRIVFSAGQYGSSSLRSVSAAGGHQSPLAWRAKTLLSFQFLHESRARTRPKARSSR